MQEGLPRRYFWDPLSQVLFCGVCKVGFKSLEELYGNLSGSKLLVGLKAVTELSKHPKAIAQFVREPRDRLVSMYEYFRQGDQAPMPGMSAEEILAWYEDTWGTAAGSFDNFVLNLPKVIENHHFRPQHSEHGTLADHRWRLDRAQFAHSMMKRMYAPAWRIKFPHTNRVPRQFGTVGRYFDSLSTEAYSIYEAFYGPDERFYKDAAPRI